MRLKVNMEHTVSTQFIFDTSSPNFSQAEAIKAFHEFGVIVLKNIFRSDILDNFIGQAECHLQYPSIAGSFGYYKKDYPKRFLDPFSLEDGAEVCLNATLIDLVEAYMDSDCILSEANIKLDKPTSYVYFPIHADYCPGLKRSPTLKAVTQEDLKMPLAVGAAMYLRDTSEGAFSYCIGTHKLMAPKGARLSDYSLIEQNEIMATKIRLDGQRGDVILFDDRGFHGPDQPSSKHRLVMLLDWFSVKIWGDRVQMAPFRIYSSSLSNLSEKQLHVLGVGARTVGRREEYHVHSFRDKHPRLNQIATVLINSTGLVDHWKKTIRHNVSKFIK